MERGVEKPQNGGKRKEIRRLEAQREIAANDDPDKVEVGGREENSRGDPEGERGGGKGEVR